MKFKRITLFVLLVSMLVIVVTPTFAGGKVTWHRHRYSYQDICDEIRLPRGHTPHGSGWRTGSCPRQESDSDPAPKGWQKEGDSHPWVPGPFETQMSIASNPAWVGNTIQVMFEDGTEILECRGVVEPLGDISCVFEPEVAGPVTLYTYMNGSLVSTNVVDGHTAYYGTFDATNMVLRMGALPYPG